MRTTDTNHPEVKRGQPARAVRRWSRETKRQAVEDTFAPGMSVSIVARRYDVNANQLFTWHRQYYRGELGDVGAQCRSADFVRVAVLNQGSGAMSAARMKQLPPPAPVAGGQPWRRSVRRAPAGLSWS